MGMLVHSMSPTNEGHQVEEWGQHSYPPSGAVTSVMAMKMEPMMKPEGAWQLYLLQVLRSRLSL